MNWGFKTWSLQAEMQSGSSIRARASTKGRRFQRKSDATENHLLDGFGSCGAEVSTRFRCGKEMQQGKMGLFWFFLQPRYRIVVDPEWGYD